MAFIIKEYDRTYKQELINILLEICVEELGITEYSEDLIEHVEKKKFKKAWLVMEDNKVIATFCYTERTSSIAEIKKVYVKSQYRSKGIGKDILDFVINFIRQKEYDSIYVGTNDRFPNARSFYEKNGFKFAFYEDDGYVLELKLK